MTLRALVRLFGPYCLSVGMLFGQAAPPQETPNVADTAQPGAPASAASPTTAAPAPVPRRPRFVPVLISVTDSSGNPFLGLTKDQLTLVDTNRPVQPLELFKASDVPLHLGVILLAASPTFSQQQAAAIDLVHRAIRPKVDEAFIVSAKGKKPWPSDRLDWSQDPAELTKIIQGLDRNAGLPDAFNFEMKTDETTGDESGGRSTLQTFGGGGVSVFDIAYSMMSSDPRPSRRVLVIFRDPWSHSAGFGNRANLAVEAQMRRVIAAAQEMHISAFVVGLEDTKYNGIVDNTIGKNYISLHAGDDGGAGTMTRNFDKQMERDRIQAYNGGRTNVQRIATETGGAAYWSMKKNYSDAIASIANQIAGQYLVTFTPGDVGGGAHTLKVSSGNARVLAQSGFYYDAGQ